MGGDIWVESKIGKGTKVTFTVKVERSNKRKVLIDEKKKEFNETGAASGNLYKGKWLLAAEDVDINLEVLIALLQGSGVRIDCAKNGQEALDMVTADPEKYDLIFMDIQMPQMDGLEATRRIRALPGMQHKRTPIVAITANVFKDDIEACLEAGMDDHLSKPLDISRVFEVLRKYLK
jgi:CheY-like chemotaxis protein